MADTKKTAKPASSDSDKEPTTEAEVKEFSATGGRADAPISAGPSQDDLNPAFAPVKEDDDK